MVSSNSVAYLFRITSRSLSDYESQTTALLQMDICHQNSITSNPFRVLFKQPSPGSDRDQSPAKTNPLQVKIQQNSPGLPANPISFCFHFAVQRLITLRKKGCLLSLPANVVLVSASEGSFVPLRAPFTDLEILHQLLTPRCLTKDTGLSFETFLAGYVGKIGQGILGSKFPMTDPCLSLSTRK